MRRAGLDAPRRVVVTGVGVVTPIGTGREQFWGSLLAGRGGVSAVESFDTGGLGVHLGAEVKGFRAEEFVLRQDVARLGRASRFAVAAARLALADAGLDAAALDALDAGVSMGTTSGEPREVERFDDCYVAGRLDTDGPDLLARYPCHLIPAHVASE
ncbi:MAG TPA: beta-ketoacyl synthase N-terminal-like domain-containing protein, partial [Pyrinomonadaceae bacterium]